MSDLAAALDMVGARWALLIVERLLDEPQRYGDLQRDLGVPTNILATRLRELETAGVLYRLPLRYNTRAYALTGDYLSAASFLGIAGAIAVNGYDGFGRNSYCIRRRLLRPRRGSARLLRPRRRRGGWGLPQQVAQRFPRLSCSRSMDSKSALKLPLPKPSDPWRSMISKKTVGRSPSGLVKICSR